MNNIKDTIDAQDRETAERWAKRRLNAERVNGTAMPLWEVVGNDQRADEIDAMLPLVREARQMVSGALAAHSSAGWAIVGQIGETLGLGKDASAQTILDEARGLAAAAERLLTEAERDLAWERLRHEAAIGAGRAQPLTEEARAREANCSGARRAAFELIDAIAHARPDQAMLSDAWETACLYFGRFGTPLPEWLLRASRLQPLTEEEACSWGDDLIPVLLGLDDDAAAGVIASALLAASRGEIPPEVRPHVIRDGKADRPGSGLYGRLTGDELQAAFAASRARLDEMGIPPAARERWPSDDPSLCEHSNENPSRCPCSADCYCRTRTCRNDFVHTVDSSGWSIKLTQAGERRTIRKGEPGYDEAERDLSERVLRRLEAEASESSRPESPAPRPKVGPWRQYDDTTGEAVHDDRGHFVGGWSAFRPEKVTWTANRPFALNAHGPASSAEEARAKIVEVLSTWADVSALKDGQ
jgi:hypothetical protein